MQWKEQRSLAQALLLILVICASTTLALASPSKTVLVTGGAGYIGSHTCLELLEAKEYKVVVIDNLDNSSEESLQRVRELTKCDPARLAFRQCDIRDKNGLKKGKRKLADTFKACFHY
jgi:UDP-glucose 4-epimerase